ncbi:MAG: hypothetical protein Q9217_003687 [Psora testacea]
MFAIRSDEEILRYLRYTKQFWSDLLQQDKTAMAKVDQATVEALQLTAPWASTLDAKILRGKILGGELFCRFSQQEREEIWIRLQSFKGLIPSLFELFENIKCLEAWADCLKWLVCLGPRETLFTAMEKIYTGINQSVDSALVQKNETTFESVPGSSARRIDLGHRQLYAFAMRYYCEIPKKPSGKDLLAKPKAMLNTTRLREMADLANRLGFESSEINALKQFPKPADPMIIRGNEKPTLVTDGPGEIRKDRCGMPHAQNYEEDRKFVFITHLHDDRDEQSEGITSYFRLRSTYLKFYGMPDDSNPQQNLTTAIGESFSPAFHLTRSTYSPREDQARGAEHMDIDGEQTEDTVMQDGEVEEQRPPFQAEGALAQETTMQRQRLLSEAGVLKKKEYEQEQYRQKLTGDANALVEEEQRLEQKRQKLLSNASTLEKQEQEQELHRQQLVWNAGIIREQEQEQEQRRQKLLSHTNILEKQGQEQEQYRQKLVKDANAFEEQDQEKEQQRQKLLSDENTLEKQEQEQEQYRQRLGRDAIALREQEYEQERRRQKLISHTSALKEGEEEQEQMYYKLTGDASALREQEQKREEQRRTFAKVEKELLNRKQRQEEQQQTLAADASELTLQEQKQEERRHTLAAVADELVNQEQRQKEQRQKLAEYSSNLGKQELRQNEQRKKLTVDISELYRQEKRYKELKKDKLKQEREQKRVEPKILGSKLDESGTIQERDERDIRELQRQGQVELADLESSSRLELEYGGIDADRSVPEVRAQNYLIDAVQKGSTQVEVSAPKGENSPAQEHGPQQDKAQVKGQEERLEEEAQEPKAQERRQEHRVQERGHEHQTQENGQEDRAHGDGAHEDGAHEGGAYEDATHDDKVQGGRQADEAQEVVQEDKAHKEGQDNGAYEDDIREYRARKRRVMTKESDDGVVLRAQQVREGRNPVEKGKYQRLNRFGSSNHNIYPEGDTLIDSTGEGDTTPVPRKRLQTPRRQQRQDL